MIRLSVELSTDKVAPSEFRIFRSGENPSEKGTFTFDALSAASVMENYQRHGKALLFDFNHGTTFANPTPDMAMSAGDFVPAVRNGELWATACNWNDYGRQMLEGGKYRFFSPLFNHDKGRITWLRNVALTNLPALDQIAPLVAASATEGDDPMECKSCAEMSSKLSAAEGKLTALAADFELFKKKAAGKGEPDGDEGKMTALRAGVVALTGEADIDASMGVLRANKRAADELIQLRAEATKREETETLKAFDGLIDEAVTALKVTPAEVAEFRGEFLVDGKVTAGGVKALRAAVKRMVPQVNGAPTKQQATGADPITASVREMAKTLGIDVNEYAKSVTAAQHRA